MTDVNQVYQMIRSCTNCKLAGKSKNSIEKRLLPSGSSVSNFMFIGISPSANAKGPGYYFSTDTKNKVFQQNRSLLVSVFNQFNIDFDTMWKTNVQKCIGETNNLDEKIFNTCYEATLKKEIDFIKPKLIFLLGKAVSNLFGLDQIGLMEYVKDIDAHIVSMYHPSYSLRGGISENNYAHHIDHLYDKIRNIVINNSFVNLHHHNQFSLRDGLGIETDIVQRLAELKYSGMSLTNHGNVNAHFRQYEACKKYNLKPIFGNEAYYSPNLNELRKYINEDTEENIQKRKELSKETHHITVLAKNIKGYYNLIALTNKSWLYNFYRVPRIDFDMLKEHREGLIILSGCPQGFIPSKLYNNEYEKAKNEAIRFKELFGDDFYIELLLTTYPKQKKINDLLIQLSKELNIKTVITTDTHYINKEDFIAQRIVWSHKDIKLKYENIDKLMIGLDDSLGDDFNTFDLYIKSLSELKESHKNLMNNDIFTNEVYEDSIFNVNEIFSKIEYFEMDNSLKMPKLYDNSHERFLKLIKQGIESRKLVFDNKAKKRLKEEIKIISQLDFIDYFLILQDIVNWTKNTFGINSVGPGRGSSAGSLVNYLLYITNVNPLDYKMLMFERFISLGRADLVDIDVDFAPSIRPRVFEYIIKRFGRQYVAQIGNYQTIKLKTAIQDVLRVFDIPYQEVIKVTKLIGNLDQEIEEKSIEEIRKVVKPLDELLNKYPKISPILNRLKGQIRSSGQHAAGLIISSKNLINNIPLTKTSTKTIVSANTEGGDHHELTAMGYIKYDILSLSTLDHIMETIKIIKEVRNIEIDFDKLVVDSNKEIYELLSKGDTFNIFQFSSGLATDYLKSMKPENLDELSIASALLRPGPLNQDMHTEYAIRKKNKEYYTHEALKDILNPTFGILIYQEQILRIAQELGGFSKSESNVFRKALVKYERSPEHEKERNKKVESFSKKLKKGLINKGLNKKEAQHWWEMIESFARYGFNFSHSLSYSILSYRQLYLKYYFAIEFYAATFNVEEIAKYPEIINNILKFNARKFDYDDYSFLRNYKIKVDKPQLKFMNPDFMILDNKIYPGLTKLKYLSEAKYKILKNNLNESKCNDIYYILKATYQVTNKKNKIVNKKVISKQVYETLVYSGALDYIDSDRNKLLETFIEVRKSDVELIKDEVDRFTKENDRLGFCLSEIQWATELQDKLKKDSKIGADLSSLSTNNSDGQVLDIFKVIDISNRVTKNNKKYKLLKCQTLTSIFDHIFMWNDLKVEKNKYYLGMFEKNRNFISVKKFKLV